MLINPNGHEGVIFDEMIKRIEKLFIYKRVLCHGLCRYNCKNIKTY
jgi:hypothetical protein